MDQGLPGDTERRQRILRATARLLHRYGPAKTTIADIAREAEIAVGTVYLEFSSKDAILSELSTDQHGAVLEAMRAAAAQEGRPYRDLLQCRSRAVQEAHERFLDDERALVAELLRSGARVGELDVLDPDLAARAVLRAYACFAPPWLFAGPRPDVEALLRAMHDLVLYGLVQRPPSSYLVREDRKGARGDARNARDRR